MTTRVFDFQRSAEAAAQALRPAPPPRRKVSLVGAALTALLVAPVAGAGNAPTGWLVTAATGLLMLHVAAFFGARLPWGWLTLVFAMLGLGLPRGAWPDIGPALFVATAVSLAVWFAARDLNRKPKTDRPQLGSRERAAQVMLGFSGERHVGRVLAGELPQEYVLFNGLKLPRGAGDIDHLVVGPSGVFLLETKTMAGHIVCKPDGTWHRTRVGRGGTAYSAYIGDPAAQVQRNIFAVRQALRYRLPAFVTRAPVWVEGLVVFAHPETELETASSRVPAVLLEQVTQRICSHVPRRRLEPKEVDLIVAALLDEGRASERGGALRQSAQALVELALLLPLVLVLLFGTVALSRIVQARTAVIAVAQEAARAAALASTQADALDRMRVRADLVAPGLGLDARALVLGWDVSQFNADPGEVIALVDYPVGLRDLPMIGGLPTLMVHAEHAEWVDPFRSGIAVRAEVAR
jgi:nuclease-like protein/TadE-like protein